MKTEPDYPYYLKSPASGRVVKIVDAQTMLYVDVYGGLPSGDFVHSRGRTSYPDGKRLMEAVNGYEPSCEEEYITALKNYFAADKKVREAFIKTYNL